MTRKILMACRVHWTSACQVGSHQLARAFLDKGWEVFFVSDPISPLHLLQGIDGELKNRFSLYRNRAFRDGDGRLQAYVPGALLTPHNKPMLRSSWVHRSWQNWAFPDAVKEVRRRGFGKVDLIYIDSPIQSFWLSAIEHDRSVYRVTDRNDRFDRATPALQQMEKEIARAVDAVVYSGMALESYVADMHPKRACHLPNGVNFDHFAEPCLEAPEEYARIPRPRAVYVGAIDSWFDFDLVDRLAERFKDLSLILIGPDAMARNRLKQRSNLHILGTRSYDRLPGYLQHADVGIIPFDVAGNPELVHGINPLKLYEYMACGLPVVATEWRELINIQSPALLARTDEEFAGALENAMAGDQEKEPYMNYARDNAWNGRVNNLLGLLEEI